ncbi:MAG: hypothetical protein WCT10_01145 [Patescibacteria group bacterium]|jgi:hypothetical protein
MRLFGGQRIRRRAVRKFVWLIITFLAVAAMVVALVAPALNR